MTKKASISINIMPIPESEWSVWDFIAIFFMGSAIPSDSLVSITLLPGSTQKEKEDLSET